MNSEIEEVPEHLHFTADNHVHEKMWTAQMTGTHFLKHEYVETDDYLAEDLERIDFTLTDTF